MRYACGSDQPVGLDQHVATFSLRPQRKADDDEGKAEQQATMTRRWAGLSGNEGTMACFPFGHPYRNSEYAQRDLGFNLTE